MLTGGYNIVKGGYNIVRPSYKKKKYLVALGESRNEKYQGKDP